MAETLFTDIIDNLGKTVKKIKGDKPGKFFIEPYFNPDGSRKIVGGYGAEDRAAFIEKDKDGTKATIQYGNDDTDKKFRLTSDGKNTKGEIVFKFADGGSTNGSAEKAFSAKVNELMDDGYDFGEAVKEAMRQGYAKGGLAKAELQKLDSVFNEVNKRGLRPQIKRLYDLGYGAGEIAKRLSTGANKVLFEGSTGKSRMQRYLQKAKQTYNWSEPEFKLRNQQGINLKDPKTIEKFQKIADKPKYKNFNKRDLVRAGVLSKKAAEKITPQRTERVSKPENKNATKDRRKARIKKFSSDVAEKKSAAPLGSKKESSHLGSRKSKVTTGNKAMLPKDVNKLSYHPFEKKIDNIQYRQRAIELNRSMSVEAKRKALAKLAAEDRALRLKYPEYRNIKSRLSFTESPMSKTGFKYKDVIRDPKITLSGGKTGANVVFKNASKADLAKIKDLATKGNSLYSFPANIAEAPSMTKGAVKSIAKSVGKVLGVAALPLEAYFMKQMYDEGKTMAEILASPLMLEGVVGEGQRLMTMDPVERQAVKNAQIAEDFSMMDTDFMTPAKQGLEAVDVDMVNERANREIEKRRKAKAVQRNKTLPNQGLLRILANPTYEGVL